jgi:lipopolysaccharide transport system ATP-binding protein
MNDKLISLRNVSKSYKIFDNPRSRLAHAIAPKYIKGLQEICALKDITIDIDQGESVAIIGRNGGGKSTLLEIITGTLTPTRGEVSVKGCVSALLELGSGFNPHYSGRDNILLNGLLLGLSRQDVLNSFEEIISFAEIGDALDRPVKTYSTGMMMRLAFAVQVLCRPQILIIDEALSVGDFFFQQKCLKTIRELHHKGTTLLFVSHDMGTVRDLCSRVIYLKQGNVIFDGPANQGIRLFFNETTPKNTQDISQAPLRELNKNELNLPSEVDVPSTEAIWSSHKAPMPGTLCRVALYDMNGLPATSFRIGETLVLRVKFIAYPSIANHIGFVLYDKFGAVRTTTGSLYLNVFPQPTQTSPIKIFELHMKLMTEAGQYGLMVTLSYQTDKNKGHRLDDTGMVGPITVNWDYEKETAPFLGQVGLPTSAEYLL